MPALAVVWVVVKGFFVKYWELILIGILIIFAIGFVYGKGRADATKACNARWEQKVAADEAKRVGAINDKIDELRRDSKELAQDQIDGVSKIQRGVNKVIQDLKKLPRDQVTNIYTTKEDCKPTELYVEKWNAINEEATRAIK
jgi:hypothetical protein